MSEAWTIVLTYTAVIAAVVLFIWCVYNEFK